MTIVQPQEKSHTVSGFTVSIIFHVVIIALLLLIRFGYEAPGSGEPAGIQINFGNSETGMGDEIPMSKDAGQPQPNVAAAAATTDKEDNNIATQENEVAPEIKKAVVKTKVKPAPVVTPVKTQPAKTAPTVNKPVEKVKPAPVAKALFPGSKSNNVSSEGNKGGAGDQGKTNGNPFTHGSAPSGNGNDPLSPNGGNGPGGKGVGPAGDYPLAGRTVLSKPSIPGNLQKTGRVRVNITVDKNGKVVRAEATRLNSTTDDSELFRLAENTAKQIKYNPSASGVEQHGTIEINFGFNSKK